MKKYKLFIILVLLCSVIVIACGCSSKYNYERTGFIGLKEVIKIEMTTDEIKDISLSGITPTENDTHCVYENIKLFEKYSGNFYVCKTSEDSNDISDLFFAFEENDIKYDDILDELTNNLGEPDHKENINDKTKDSTNTMWYLDNSHYLNLKYLNNWESIYLYLNTYDISLVEKNQKAKETINANNFLAENLSAINSKAGLIGSSLQDVIDNNGAEFNDITTSRITFIEKSNLFGYSGYYEYEIENPNNDNFYSDFIGEIKDISFNFDSITDTDADKILDYLIVMFGKNEDDEESDMDALWKSTYSECIVNLKNTDKPYISIRQNNEAYIYDVEVNYSDSNEVISEYTSMSTDELHINDIDYNDTLSTTDTSFERCWKIAQEAVLGKLKSPSTATFPEATYRTDDIKIVRYNNEYRVYSWVDAQNSFGATIRTRFLVKIMRDGSSFVSKGVTFNK